MRIFITGAAGQLGKDVAAELCRRGHDIICSDISGEDMLLLDLTQREEVGRVLRECEPDAVVHCAAWTAVDLAEDNEDAARAVNADGTENVALACRELGCRLMYISTDYVFDGSGSVPHSPECESFAPLNVYGRTKLEGEMAVRRNTDKHFIVRIAWVFGSGGGNFVKTMLALGKKYDTLRVVSDQIGTPTYTRDLARLLGDMVESEKYGCYHATNEGGYISWYDFACEIFRQAGMATKVVPVTTEEYGLSKAARPKNSRLDRSKLAESGFDPLPDWRDALSRFLEEINL